MSRESDARQILDNPMFKEVVAELKDQLYVEWLNTAPNEVDERESLHLQVHLVDRLYARFESILEDDKMTTHYRI